MHRSIEKQLLRWKDQVNRMPLLLRGARQVGKSFLLLAFGNKYFANTIHINFEKKPVFKRAFLTKNPQQICNTLALMTNQEIKPNHTFLFLDEIQECPEAIEALRYFKEEMPGLHVAGAGSLLEFTLNDEQFHMPVGRIQFYYLKPCSFTEYLMALGNDKLIGFLQQVNYKNATEIALHEHLLTLMRQYLVLGGMPAVIKQYLDTSDYLQCQEIQANLFNTFRGDFGKYSKQAQHKYLQALFEEAPKLVGQHFHYVDVDPHMQSRDLKLALQALCDAGLIYQIFSGNANGLPLNAALNKKKFKLLFLDVGLVQYTNHLSPQLLLSEDFFALKRGALVEQLVGQELLTLFPFYEAGELFFWERNKPGSSSEVDYVIHVDDLIIPVEVKVGATGRLKSLRIFMEEKKSILGIRISQQPLYFENKILSVPLYMVNEIPRLVKEIIQKG